MKNQEKEERLRWYPRFETVKQYREAKLRILRVDMYIEPTLEELNHLSTLKTEGDIDRWTRGVIERYWNGREL
jgi:hypothetical protein